MAQKLGPVFDAQSVALIGASSDINRPSGRPLNNLLNWGYKGKIFPVNPTRSEILGVKTFPTLTAIGEPVDLAVIMTAASTVPALLEEGAALGVRSFIVFASGFGETGPEGVAAQAFITDFAKRTGIPVVGPNCLGVMNRQLGFCPTFSNAARSAPVAGGLSFAGQSGAIGSYWLDLVKRNGLGLAKFISVGNEADVTVADAIDYFAADDSTKVISVYIEGVSDGTPLRAALARARAAGKPVLMLRGGCSETGAAAAASHTGAVAGANAAWDAVLESYGVVSAGSLSELVDIAKVMLMRPVGTASHPAVITVSGGIGTLIADRAAEHRISIDQPSSAATETISAFMPKFASVRNPFDLTAAVTVDPGLFAKLAQALVADDQYDSIVFFIGLMFHISDPVVETIRDVLAPSRKPVLVIWIGAEPELIARVEATGVPAFSDVPAAIAALAAVGRFRSDPRTGSVVSEPPLMSRAAGGRQLSEYRSQAALGPGFPLSWPAQALLETTSDVAERAADLRFPLVAKLQSPQMPHKTDHGAVKLRLGAVAAVEEAVSELLQIGADLKIAVDGVLVQEMVGYDVELLVGLQWDPTFGPMMVLGRGGTNVEVDRDVVTCILPASALDVEGALRRLRCLPLFEGARGNAKVDLAELARRLHTLSELYLGNPNLVELEINPLAVRGPDSFVALDALVSVADE